jgi:hypothetical protein
MPKTTVSCPRCRTPITADITRLFDLSSDPHAKEKLLSGSANQINCPVCQYQGVYPSPIVYHDADKDLLLTYCPPEATLPGPEQEKIIGPLIKKVVDTLPPEKRKGYLFRPQTMLTQKLLFETILKADGITPEMMKAQQEKLTLISQFAAAAPEKPRADLLPGCQPATRAPRAAAGSILDRFAAPIRPPGAAHHPFRDAQNPG